MEQPYFFPVGYTWSQEDFRQYSFSQMWTRSLNDPAYAGCEAGFDWRKYIDVTIADEALTKDVIRALDQFAQTTEGQQTIRQAQAMQAYRVANGYAKSNSFPVKIAIMANTDPVAYEIDHSITHFDPATGVLVINTDEMRKYAFLATDGKFYFPSLQNLIYHELCHAKDSLVLNVNHRLRELFPAFVAKAKAGELEEFREKMRRFEPEENRNRMTPEERFRWDQENLFSSILEFPAILETNEFASKYYGEPYRELVHSAALSRRKGLDWALAELDIIEPTRRLPNLPEGIAYQDFNAQALGGMSPQCVASTSANLKPAEQKPAPDARKEPQISL